MAEVLVLLPLADVNAKPDPTHLIAYLAGFVDGEGCIRVACNRGNVKRGCSPSYRLHIVVCQKEDNKRPLELLKETFGGWLGRSSSRKGCKPMMSWVADGDIAAEALRFLLPYLNVKRDAARVGLSFHYMKEVYRLGRKSGEKLSPAEVEVGELFTKLFYAINGNKPIDKPLTYPKLSPLGKQDEEVLPQVQ